MEDLHRLQKMSGLFWGEILKPDPVVVSKRPMKSVLTLAV